MLNAKKGLSSRQLSRDLHVHKDTAWRISMKIREAMRDPEHARLLSGMVEADETYIGGKPRRGDGKPHKRGRGTDKTPVVGLIERGGNVKAKVFKKDNVKAHSLSALVRRCVDINNATLITDEFHGYWGIKAFMPHLTVNHKLTYCDGEIHTNNAESFWAILKRGIIGQFHKVSVHYLPRYLDEFCYRFNHRKSENLFGLTIAKGLGVSI
jgi:transposase-like protein